MAGKDGSTQQDHGGNEEEFSVQAYLWGPNFDVERDELEDALFEPGPGALVLPTRGEMWARIVGDPDTNERRAEGYCTISFQVVVEEKSSAVRTRTDTVSTLKNKSSVLKAASKADFASKFSVVGMPAKYVRKAVAAINDVTSKLRDVQGKINGVLNPIEDLTASIADLDRTAEELLSTPQALANKLMDVVSGVVASANVQRNEVDRLTGLKFVNVSAYEQSLSVRTTQSSSFKTMGKGKTGSQSTGAKLVDQSAENEQAVYRLARAAALAQQADTYADAPFDSSTLAMSVLGSVNDEVGELQEYGADDGMFASLADVRSAAAQHLTQTASNLPRTVTHEPKQEVPALLIAHYLYGDARLEAEIVARNRLKHPSLVSGPIEIIEP